MQTADAPGQLHVLGEEGDTLGVDGAQVRVLQQVHQEGLSRLARGTTGEAAIRGGAGP